MMSITSKAIWIEADRAPIFPFILPLEGAKLYCHAPLRILPKKRITCLANFKQQAVVAKIFFDPKKWKKHGLREVKGVSALVNNQILTPPLLYHGQTGVDKVYVVIFEYFPQAVCFDQAWRQIPCHKKILLQQLMETLTKQHQHGVYQNDIHLENFLVDHQIYTIDGDAIISKGSALTLKESFLNLALLLAQFEEKDILFLRNAVQLYVTKRGWVYSNKLEKKAQRLIQKAKCLRRAQYLKKTLRDCSEFAAQNNKQMQLVWDRRYDKSQINALLQAAQDHSAYDAPKLLKNGHTCTVTKMRLQAQDYVIKRYNIKNFKHALGRSCRRTRAAISWKNAHRLKGLGIATPMPVLLIEKKQWIFNGQAFLITAFNAGKNLADNLTEKKRLNLPWQPTALGVVELFRQFYTHRLLHGDLKASNILIVNDQPVIIDLDALTQCSRFNFLFGLRWKKEMARFLKNWDNVPDIKNYFQQHLQEKGLL